MPRTTSALKVPRSAACVRGCAYGDSSSNALAKRWAIIIMEAWGLQFGITGMDDASQTHNRSTPRTRIVGSSVASSVVPIEQVQE